MYVDVFFDLYFNFLSVKTEINKKNNKRLNLINLEGSDALKRQKYDTWIAMWLNHFENNVIWTVFKGFLKLHSYISVFWGFFMNFRDFRVFAFGYRSQKENSEITENLYFLVYKVQMHMDLFFDHYFNFLGAKTKINKNVLNLINLDGLEAFKRQTPGAWLEIWVNHFWFDVIWRTSQLFLKLHSHNSVLALLQHFCAFQVFVFGCRAQKENPEITENLYFTVFFLKLYQICFCVSLSLFLLPEFVIPLFNCYFRDFRDFLDFWVFDLANFRRCGHPQLLHFKVQHFHFQ